MHEELHNQLKKQPDLLIRRRCVYLNRFIISKNLLIVPNEDPVIDQIDEELLRRVETYNPDLKTRYGTVELIAEDIHDEISPEHKKERLELANIICDAIENMDIETLKGLPMFQNSRIEHFIDIKIDPKKWLYSGVHGSALRRDLCNIRGVKFSK